MASPVERALAWSVHLYTALGVVLALAALAVTVNGNARAAFLFMAVELFIDSTDGTMARAARVKEVIPEFDGSKLDDIVDYLNYTLVPMFFAYRMEMLPAAIALPVAALPLLASAYGFCQTTAKTADYFFTGFPSYWNIAVYYLYALSMPAWLNAAILVFLSAMVFVPIGYLYPSRNPFLRGPTLALATLWGAAMLVSLFQLPHPSRTLLWASLAFPAYYFALSFYLHFRRPIRRPSPER
ncbi:MAG: CDP-alcohol phosphatidyltransferase family protein [Candidatus Binatia bacterium]